MWLLVVARPRESPLTLIHLHCMSARHPPAQGGDTAFLDIQRTRRVLCCGGRRRPPDARKPIATL